jgi:hypothetical protein
LLAPPLSNLEGKPETLSVWVAELAEPAVQLAAALPLCARAGMLELVAQTAAVMAEAKAAV